MGNRPKIKNPSFAKAAEEGPVVEDLGALYTPSGEPKTYDREQVDKTLARLEEVIRNQRRTIDALTAERREILGFRIMGSAMLDRLEPVNDPDDSADGVLVFKISQEELVATDPTRYELSVEEWGPDGAADRFYCVRIVNPDGPDPVAAEEAGE